MSKIIKIFIIVINLTLFTLGCTSLFMNEKIPQTPKEAPKVLEESPNTSTKQKSSTSNDKIKDFKTLTQGVISDISSSENTIALISQDSAEDELPSQEEKKNNLSLYNLKDDEIQPILSTKANIKSGKFDTEEKGLYYLENEDESDFQLYWINNTGSKKIKISPSEHFISSNFYLMPNNDVYYGTKDGKIVQANKDHLNYIISTLNLGPNYNIQQIYYYKKKDLIVFSAYKNDQLNLYTLNLKSKKIDILISNIDGNFKFSKNEEKLLYVTTIPDSNKQTLWMMNLKNKKALKIMKGFPKRPTFSPQVNEIFYLDKTDPNSDLQNIWIYDLENKKSKQIAANLKIASDLYWNPKGGELLFSTYDTIENQIESTVNLLDYKK